MTTEQGSVFPQKVIAVIWDFDRTLIPGYMQEPLFRHFDVDADNFWKEVNLLPAFYSQHGYPLIPKDTAYLSHMLTYVREGIFKDLNNRMLREFGGELQFYPGLPNFFVRLRKRIEESPAFAKHDIKLEHYVVSTGLRQMILGSRIAKHVEGVWACEFLGMTAPPGFQGKSPDAEDPSEAVLRDVAFAIDNTSKTRAVFEINKGVNKHPKEISVNSTMPHEHRRVPFNHMIYIADGPSDVPVFSIVNQYGGKTFAVYHPSADEREFRQVRDLQEQGRVQSFGPANYMPGRHTDRCLTSWAEEIAEQIAAEWQGRLGEKIGMPPQHLVDTSDSQPPQDVITSSPPGLDPKPDVPDDAKPTA